MDKLKYDIKRHGEDHSFIVNGKRFLQVHPPKNAGTSFSQTIGFKDHHHTLSWFIENQEKEYRASFVYGLIRNPWTRIESWWKYNEYRNYKSFNEWGEDNFKSIWTMKAENAEILHQENWLEYKEIPKLNLLIRFEDLGKGYDQLVRIMGIRNLIGNLKHININRRFMFKLKWSQQSFANSMPIVGAFGEKYQYKFVGQKDY